MKRGWGASAKIILVNSFLFYMEVINIYDAKYFVYKNYFNECEYNLNLKHF